MRKTFLLAACLLLLLPCLLTSCASRRSEVHSKPGNQSERRIKLTFFGNKYEARNVKVIEQILSAYMKEHPNVSISYESAKGNAYFALLDKRLGTGNADDIFMVNHDVVLRYGAQGALKDLSVLPELDRFSALSLSQMRDASGSVYYVPTTISAFGLYCNLDLLEAHRQPVPSNRQEMASVCDYFKTKGITPIVANNDISLKTVALAISEYPLRASGGIDAVYRKLNQGELRISEFLQPGLITVSDWIRRGYIDPAVALVTAKTKDDLAQFAQGKTPFLLTGAWAAGTVREKAKFRFEVRPYPILDDGSVLVINADTRLSVSSRSKHVEQAADFVRFFLREEHLERFVRNQSSFSPLTGGHNSSSTEILPLYEALQSGRFIIGANENLDLPIWQLSKDAVQELLRGESLNDVSARIDRAAKGQR